KVHGECRSAPPPLCPTAPPPPGRPTPTGPQPSTSSCPPPAHPPAVEDDLQFVLCERCRQESPNLKLLTCLHTLCFGCLSENKPIGQCPVCQTAIPQASGIPDMDNLLFTNLQARLSIYKKIRDGHGLNCCRCRGTAAAMWCSECEEFLCTKCFEDHQWFFKKKSHEAKRVEDLRAESAHQFLEDSRKSCNLFCSRPGHADQGHISSIYCNKCEKALCCSCALLDSQHTPFCDIHSETQRRQEELVTMSQELKQKRSSFEATFEVLQAEASRLEQAQQEMRELIRQHVEQLVRLIRREEEELLGLVEARQEQGRRELARELQRVEGVLRRMEASERLVEKVNLYATEQEVMDMQPFIKSSLEELQQLQLPVARDRAQPGDFAECRARLQALVERVTGHPGEEALAIGMDPARPQAARTWASSENHHPARGPAGFRAPYLQQSEPTFTLPPPAIALPNTRSSGTSLEPGQRAGLCLSFPPAEDVSVPRLALPAAQRHPSPAEGPVVSRFTPTLLCVFSAARGASPA
uniref:Protein PML n=1 Tax=Otus sunia TaxID=257818 RepID=A0A8C8AWR1_9STRI